MFRCRKKTISLNCNQNRKIPPLSKYIWFKNSPSCASACIIQSIYIILTYTVSFLVFIRQILFYFIIINRTPCRPWSGACFYNIIYNRRPLIIKSPIRTPVCHHKTLCPFLFRDKHIILSVLYIIIYLTGTIKGKHIIYFRTPFGICLSHNFNYGIHILIITLISIVSIYIIKVKN